MTEEGMKICSKADCHKAGEPQPHSAFFKRSSFTGVLQSECRACANARGKKTRAANRAEKLALEKARKVNQKQAAIEETNLFNQMNRRW